MAAMDRWIFHSNERHPAVDRPWIAFLSAAQQRLRHRREGQKADPAAYLVVDHT